MATEESRVALNSGAEAERFRNIIVCIIFYDMFLRFADGWDEKDEDVIEEVREVIEVAAVTSQHVLYYCTYYSVSFSCTVHCTYYIYCTLYIQYIFPVSLFPMLRFHLQHRSHSCSHLEMFTHLSSLVYSLSTCVHTTLILTTLLPSA
jgi:hypothetical protein